MTTPLRKLPDLAARTTALTATDRSLLVEAGAGSGKTSIMAGRISILFAGGVEPKNVAAITFTEFAASELMIRIEKFVGALAKGDVPRDLKAAFPQCVSAEQQAHLVSAKQALDQITCTTIHGFAQSLIKPYPVEACIDPGADIVDPAEADLAFGERYEAWLKQHLSGSEDDEILAEIVLADENFGLKLIREIAHFLRHNRDARPADAPWSNGLAKQFATAAAAFKKELGRHAFQEEDTDAACRAFTAFVGLLGGPALGAERPSNHALIEAINLPRHESCFKQDGGKRLLRTKGKWETAARADGRSKIAGTQAYDAVNVRYEACHDAFETLMSAVAGEILFRLAAAVDGLMKEWREYKRAAALLDFDDLLYTARDLLAQHDDIREALASRFQYVLVDEFQDTDPLQIEILWRLCGDPGKRANRSPLTQALRPGALFLVGDPKQAIYRFRGADVNAYLDARTAVGRDALIEITANFRSVEPILTFVNQKFAPVLASSAGQPGFTPLSPTRDAHDGALTITALDVAVDADKPTAALLRDAEATRVADLCSRMVGNLPVIDPLSHEMRACQPGDIALLAPVGTDLWRFEEALEDRGISVSTQAGKGFFRRQEVQDLIALTRTLADARDSLALGALLRGPLVGLTEGELLDVAESLPLDPDRPDRLPHLNLWTELDHIKHELARSVLEILQSLGRRARSTAPYILLSDAVSMLDARSQLGQRFAGGADRALANLDLFLEMSRAYDVRGLRAFAGDMRANWEEAVRQVEGRPDAEQQSVALITIHASKGLEWPIVIPINMTGAPQSETRLVHDRRTTRFSIPVFGAEPAGHSALAIWNEQELARERVRLWYVATTRARDLLVLPRHSAKLGERTWAKIVDFDLRSLAAIKPEKLGKPMSGSVPLAENKQTRAVFAEEAARIVDLEQKIRWLRPSLDEAESAMVEGEPLITSADTTDEAVETIMPPIAGSATRGTVLHKLMEEVLTSEAPDDIGGLTNRASELLVQLAVLPSDDPSIGISAAELAQTVARTLNLPEIAALRSRLVPEISVYGQRPTRDEEILTSGIADAVAPDAQGRIEVIVDWKSDVRIHADKLRSYGEQLRTYCQHMGATRALLVLMTTGQVIEIR